MVQQIPSPPATWTPVSLRSREHNTVDYTNAGSATIWGGSVVLVGGIPYITRRPIYPGETEAVDLLSEQPLYSFPKTTGALADRSAAYWHAAATQAGDGTSLGAVNNDSSDSGVYVGVIIGGAGADDATVDVVTFPATTVTNTILTPLANTINDVANGGALELSDTGMCEVTFSPTSTTRSAPSSSYLGQLVGLSNAAASTTYSGTVTFESVFNSSGNTHCQFTAPGQSVILVGISGGKWQLINNGATLS